MGRLSFPRVGSWEGAEEEVGACAPRFERNLIPSLLGLPF